MKKAAVISITKNGDEIMGAILAHEGYEYTPYDSAMSKKLKLSNIAGDIFNSVDALVFITSLGICVRVIAPLLRSKTTDPAVVCIPNDGSLVISVLGGHLGGANRLTLELAGVLGAQPVITTATDLMGIKAPDILAKENGLYIDSMADCKEIASILVDGGRLAIFDETGDITAQGYEKYEPGEKYDGIVRITNKSDRKFDTCLKLIRKNIVLGIGCKKNYDTQKMREKVLDSLGENHIHEKAVAAVCSIALKAGERAIIEMSGFFQAPYKTYTVHEIASVEHLFKCSDYVKSVVGVGAVAEPCAYLAGAHIIAPKKNMDGMTLAIGEIRSAE